MYLWSTNDGKVSWTSRVHQSRQQGTKLVSAEIESCSYSSYYYYSCQKRSFHYSLVMVL